MRQMDKLTIKTPNPKCRLYWCLIEFIDWRYSQSCWYFRPALWTIAPLTFSLVGLPLPIPCVNTEQVYCIHLNCVCYTVRGGEFGVIGGEGPQTDKTPAAKSLYMSIWSIFLRCDLDATGSRSVKKKPFPVQRKGPVYLQLRQKLHHRTYLYFFFFNYLLSPKGRTCIF